MPTADVRMVCGACGAGVSRGDTVCPSCGATLQFGGASEGITCPSCGHRNVPAAELCESCGSRLVSGSGQKTVVRPKEKRGKKPATGEKSRRHAEPWMFVAGACVIALIAYVVYLNLQSPSTSTPSSGGSPASVPPLGSVASPTGGERIAALEQAVRDRPNDPEALLALANGLHDQRAWDRAITAYQQYLKKKPDNPDAMVDMGICYFELSRERPERGEEYFGKAVAEMETALNKSPKHVPAAFNLGVIHLERGEVEVSNEWFRRAIAIDKNHPLAQRAQRMLEQHSFTK